MELKAIPGTAGYSASRDGRIFNPDGIQRTEYTNGDGYLTASVKLTDGRWQTFGIHRLVALAWLECPGNPDDYTVNHIDTDVTNNDADNLEWVTVQVNNLHASLMRLVVDRPTIYMLDVDGSYSFIDNLHMAAQVLSVDIGLAWDMVRDGIEVNGSKLFPITKHTVLPDQLRKPSIGNGSDAILVEVPVKVKSISTGRILNFKSMGAAATHFGVSASHIYQAICKDRVHIFKRDYVIVKSDDEFPEVDDALKEKSLAAGGKATWGWNGITNVLYVTESASQLIKLTGLSKKAVTTRLKRDGYGEVGDWIFSYEEQSNRILERIKGSSPS